MLAPSDPETDPHIQQAQQTTDTQLVSAHPSTLFFYLIFKAAALGIYIFGWLFTTQYILSFVAIILCLAFDFWTVKNIAGRLLVGLRWWNETLPDGSNKWIFESRPQQTNTYDSRVFWSALYLTPAIWIVFFILALLRLQISWLIVDLIAILMSSANVVGYTSCDKDAQSKFTNYVAQQSWFQTLLWNRFTVSSTAPAR